MDVTLTPEIKLQRADIQQLMVSKGDLSPEQQDWSFLLEDTKPPHIKEEQEELWISRVGEQLQGLKEADTTMFPFTPVSVKSEDEEKPQSSQLHQRQTEQMETGVDGEDCGGAEPERYSVSGCKRLSGSEVKIEDSCGSDDSVDSDFWKDTRERRKDLKSVENVQSKKTNADDNSYSCSECGKTFNKKPNLTRHTFMHTGEKPFSCPLCCKRFNRKCALTTHKRIHTGEKPLMCSVCGKTFKKKTNLATHLRIHAREKPFSSSECSKRFIQKVALAGHMLVHTIKKPYNCSECNKTSSDKSYLTKHMQIHTGEKLFSCTDCGRRFKFKLNLTHHMAHHRGASELHLNQTEEKRLAETRVDREDCGGAEPVRNSDPVRHLQLETQDKKDDSSEAETDNSDDWKDTIEEHDSDLVSVINITNMRLKTDNKSHGCSECGKTFHNKRNLTRHILVHTGYKPFSCSFCSKRFNRKCALTTHTRIHTGEKPFSCSECSKRFNQKVALTSHMLVHTREKPYSCSECNKRFTDKSYLLKHMRIHTGEKLFSCTDCGKSFNFKQSLTHHMANHRGASELHQNQTKDKRLTETDGAEPERDSDPERHLQPEIEVKIEDSSEPETPDSDVDWKETTEHQSGLNSVKNITSKRLKTNKKSHCCSECGKTFHNKRNLCRHLRIHTGEKPFSCSVCGKRFNQKGNLTSHMLVHTGEKPFSCSVCGKTFKQKATLTKHVRIHTEEKPFSCSVCT
ncbi:zinc finger protein 665 isoform X2 [Labrus bergylta]|uniref:zinc finger protein 665 isoform X2 n=1 Tax=Labrus bergylta TaxID=56723 RepID=UPI0009B2EB4C|nr:zinc finger protein 665-like isoform X2 [Labrus bergylta]